MNNVKVLIITLYTGHGGKMTVDSERMHATILVTQLMVDKSRNIQNKDNIGHGKEQQEEEELN